MPWSSLILSKLHSVESEQNQKNVSPVHSLDIRTTTDNKTIKLITSGNDKTIRIWEILAQNITIKNVQDLSNFMGEHGADNELKNDENQPTGGESPTKSITDSQTTISPTKSQLKSPPINMDDYKKKLTEHPGFSANWLKICSELRRHEKSINTARYSPSMKIIASCSDDGCVILWEPTSKAQKTFGEAQDETVVLSEHWQPMRNCPGHTADVIDLQWLDDEFLFTCGIDHKVNGYKIGKNEEDRLEVARVFSFEKESARYFQGLTVSKDKEICIAFSSDGNMHYFNKEGHVSSRSGYGRQVFQVDTVHKSCFRKGDFSPDGSVLAAPAGRSLVDGGPCMNLWLRSRIFSENPSLTIKAENNVIACKWNQFVRYDFGYILTILTSNEVIIYKYNIHDDTGEKEVFEYVCTFQNLHYDCMTDCAWVNKDKLLVSSRDGFVSVLSFDLKTDFNCKTGFVSKVKLMDFEVVDAEDLVSEDEDSLENEKMMMMSKESLEEEAETKKHEKEFYEKTERSENPGFEKTPPVIPEWIEVDYNDDDLNELLLEDSANSSPEKINAKNTKNEVKNGKMVNNENNDGDSRSRRKSSRKTFGVPPKPDPYARKSGFEVMDFEDDEEDIDFRESQETDVSTDSEPGSDGTDIGTKSGSDGKSESEDENSGSGNDFDNEKMNSESENQSGSKNGSGSRSESGSESASKPKPKERNPNPRRTKRPNFGKPPPPNPYRRDMFGMELNDDSDSEDDDFTASSNSDESNSDESSNSDDSLSSDNCHDDDMDSKPEKSSSKSKKSTSKSAKTPKTVKSSLKSGLKSDSKLASKKSKSDPKSISKSTSKSTSKATSKSTSKSTSTTSQSPDKHPSKNTTIPDKQTSLPAYRAEASIDSDPSDDSDDDFVEKPKHSTKNNPTKTLKNPSNSLKNSLIDTNSNCSTGSNSPFKLDTPEAETCSEFKHGGATSPVKQEKKKARKIVFRTLN